MVAIEPKTTKKLPKCCETIGNEPTPTSRQLGTRSGSAKYEKDKEELRRAGLLGGGGGRSLS